LRPDWRPVDEKSKLEALLRSLARAMQGPALRARREEQEKQSFGVQSHSVIPQRENEAARL
jgi:hypothetical protein